MFFGTVVILVGPRVRRVGLQMQQMPQRLVEVEMRDEEATIMMDVGRQLGESAVEPVGKESRWRRG